MNPDQAPCRECDTPISPTATRCPACSYDPSPGTLGTLVFWFFAAPFGAIFAFTGWTGILGAATGMMPYSDAVGVMFASVVVGALPWWYCIRHHERKHGFASDLGGA